MESQTETKKQLSHEQRINHLGSLPPMAQFLGVILGALIDFFYPWRLFPPEMATKVGLLVLFGSTFIIIWSQHASRKFRRNEREGKERTFLNGPYKFSTNPTSFGLALLTISLGFILNSMIIVIASALAFIVSHFFYGVKKEKLLEDKYQDEYREYKKKIKTL